MSSTQIGQFVDFLFQKEGLRFSDYSELYKWSVESLSDFWKHYLEFSEFLCDTPPDRILDWKEGSPIFDSVWFSGATVSVSKNLLAFSEKRKDQIAIRFFSEVGEEVLLTWRELYERVHTVQNWMIEQGVQKGDRVCAVLPNMPIAIIGMLATNSLGAIWSSASPDFGTKAILDRFQQISPKILITTDGYFFKGKSIPIGEKIQEIAKQIPSLKAILWESCIPEKSFQSQVALEIPLQNLDNLSIIPFSKKIPFVGMSFQDPVYVMYSSGTTGKPKCIVQGSGVLLNQKKELQLHCDLREGEKIFYYTTTGWMMWNWSLASLSLGAELCLFDGNPFYPHPKRLWEWIDQTGISVFGTSAKYLSVLEEEMIPPGTEPNSKSKLCFPDLKLTSLRCILSTGSPLAPRSYDFVYQSIKSDLQLSSISGGTDLNGCFALGAPVLPVLRGELQCRGLGMAVSVFSELGQSVTNERGELVCTKPFPSMPLFFWGDSPAIGTKYQEAYFERFPGVWCHGDFAELRENGGMLIYGRSDATLNPGGVRIGTAEIYNLLQTIPEIEDSVIIGQDWENDVRIVLFVKLKSDQQSKTDLESPVIPWTGKARAISKELDAKIKNSVKSSLSPRHVPALILEVGDVPYTVNHKKVELAVKKVVGGEAVTNREALRNPECLEFFSVIP